MSVVTEIHEWLITKAAKENLELGTDRDIWKAEAERLSSGYDLLSSDNEDLVNLILRIYTVCDIDEFDSALCAEVISILKAECMI